MKEGLKWQEGGVMTSTVICFVLGAVFPVVMVSWLFVQGG